LLLTKIPNLKSIKFVLRMSKTCLCLSQLTYKYPKEFIMKKLLIAIVATLALTGCASRTGTAVLAGTTGLIIGNAMAQPQHRVVTHEQVIIVNSTCSQYQLHSERAACERGTRQRHYEEQRKREAEAYRQGYGR